MSFTFEELEKLSHELMPLYKFMGIKIEQMSDGIFRVRVPYEANNKNHVQTMAAPIQWALAESLGGVIWFNSEPSAEFAPIMKSMNINFLKPATSDVTAEAKFTDEDMARMKKALAEDERYDFILKVTLKDASGVVVSETEGQYAIRKIA